MEAIELTDFNTEQRSQRRQRNPCCFPFASLTPLLRVGIRGLISPPQLPCSTPLLNSPPQLPSSTALLNSPSAGPVIARLTLRPALWPNRPRSRVHAP